MFGLPSVECTAHTHAILCTPVHRLLQEHAIFDLVFLSGDLGGGRTGITCGRERDVCIFAVLFSCCAGWA